MPLLGLLHLLIAIGFAVHAGKTGRPQYWIMILLFVPLVGSIAYIAFELLPELANNRRARKVAMDLRTVVDPHREFRNLSSKVRDTDTVEAKSKFAEECERKGMWPEAIVIYQQAAQGLYENDPEILRRLARAHLGAGDPKLALKTLDDLRAANPKYEHQDAHLTYARSLEAQGRLREAEAEYRALIDYFVGLEAKGRYGVLLGALGEDGAAKALFADVVRSGKSRTAVLTDADREWLRVAKKHV